MNFPDKHLNVLLNLLHDPILEELKGIAQTLGASPYLVGGAVRDVFLGNSFLPGDLDFLVLNRPAGELARQFSESVQGRYVLLDETFGIHRVIVRREESAPLCFDFSDALENSLERDLARRDLSVNAMAIGLLAQDFHDPFDGTSDLASGRIRMVSEANLVEDPLRLLRVFRMAAQLGAGEIEAETLAAVTRHAERINAVAAERIHYEFLRLLSATPCFPTLQAMGESGLLEAILPELRETRKIPPNGHHHLWLYEHTLELVHQSEVLLPEFPQWAQETLNTPFNPFVTRLGLVKLACLLHDIGKPATMAMTESGRATYYGHDAVSEALTEGICQRWKVSSDLAERVKKLVRWHLYPCQFGPDSPRKSVLRFYRRMGEETPDLLLLALADRFSTLGPDITPELLETSRQNHLWLLDQYQQEQAVLKLPPLLNGHAVMRILGISPGPAIRKVLEALQEAHQLGEVQTAEAAEVWIRQHYSSGHLAES